MLLQFEKELAQAVEALTKEQQKAAQAENEKQTQVRSLLVILNFENNWHNYFCQTCYFSKSIRLLCVHLSLTFTAALTAEWIMKYFFLFLEYCLVWSKQFLLFLSSA